MKLVSIIPHLLVVAILVIIPTVVSAQTFDEITSGDFSGDSNNPTALGQLLLGTNVISGTTGSGDRDIVNFAVGPGHEVTSILLTDFTESGGHFFGIADGAVAPAAGTDFFFAGLVFDPGPAASVEFIGSAAGGNFGGMGVPSVLNQGTYTMFFNETSIAVSPNYRVELEVSSAAVPEPGSAALLLSFAGMVMLRRRRK